MNLKPQAIAPNTSAAVAIPSEIGADLEALDEKVKSMMEKGDKVIPNGKQTKGGRPCGQHHIFAKCVANRAGKKI